jgi:hypothetical protein
VRTSSATESVSSSQANEVIHHPYDELMSSHSSPSISQSDETQFLFDSVEMFSPHAQNNVDHARTDQVASPRRSLQISHADETFDHELAEVKAKSDKIEYLVNRFLANS